LLVKDPRLVAAGMAELDRALDAVEPNGALPREMARGERSLHYMNFALLPIAGLVRIADETGYALTPARQAAFVRLVRFTYGADMDPKDFETLVGQAQMAAEPGVDLAWVPVALPSLEPLDVALAAQIRSGTASLGRLESRFYGPQAQ
jgi:poly(beta-D-mannuronate) lyase